VAARVAFPVKQALYIVVVMFGQVLSVASVVAHLYVNGVSHRDFGTKVISVKTLLKQLQTVLEDRDKTVREEAKLLAVEIYRWIGPALKPQLSSLKPVQVLLSSCHYFSSCVCLSSSFSCFDYVVVFSTMFVLSDNALSCFSITFAF